MLAMLPTALTLQNFRSFVGPQRLELRPLTLIYGLNNTGKSSLLRVLPLLGSSLEPGLSGPLDLECPAMYSGGFEDLRWRGSMTELEGPGNEDGSLSRRDIRVIFEWRNDPVLTALKYDFQLFESSQLTKRLVVREITASLNDEEIIRATWLPRQSEEQSRALTYRVHKRHEPPKEVQLVFEGLAPTLRGASDPSFSPISERLGSLRGRIRWLESRRVPPKRYMTTPSYPRWRLAQDGSDAALLLASQPMLLRGVSAWYEQSVQRRLVVREVPPAAFRIQLEHLRQSTLGVDLLDAGEGMSQVLGVLTALELACFGDSDDAPQLLALEEPESHLHPLLQQELVRKLVQAVNSPSAPHLVLETHSEQVLLGVQLQIARGHLSPEKVAVYWLRQLEDGRSIADLSTFDRQALPVGSWPAGVFSEDTDIAREIIRARKEQRT